MRFEKAGAMLTMAIVLAGLVFLLSGCAEPENPPFGALEIISYPPGADVVRLEDNSTLGTTPLKHAWETEEGKAEYIIVSLKKSGYEDTVTTFFVNPLYDSEDAAMEDPQVIEVRLKQKK
jgi:hypothetical protein